MNLNKLNEMQAADDQVKFSKGLPALLQITPNLNQRWAVIRGAKISLE
jgi:hypothetical protein